MTKIFSSHILISISHRVSYWTNVNILLFSFIHKARKLFKQSCLSSLIPWAHSTPSQATPLGLAFCHLSVLSFQTRPLISTRALRVTQIGFPHPPPLQRRLPSPHLYSHSVLCKIFSSNILISRVSYWMNVNILLFSRLTNSHFLVGRAKNSDRLGRAILFHKNSGRIERTHLFSRLTNSHFLRYLVTKELP